MLDASVNRVLHTPTKRLRDAAADQSLEAPGFAELAAAVDRLFALGEEPDEARDAPDPDALPASDPSAQSGGQGAPPISMTGGSRR